MHMQMQMHMHMQSLIVVKPEVVGCVYRCTKSPCVVISINGANFTAKCMPPHSPPRKVLHACKEAPRVQPLLRFLLVTACKRSEYNPSKLR